MATRAQLVELIRRRALDNGIGVNDDLRKITPRQVELELAQTYEDLIFLALKNMPNDLNSFAKTYKNVKVERDEDENVCYVALPAPVIQLPDNIGVRLVKPKGTDRKIYQGGHESVDLYADTDIATHYDRALWIKDRDRLIIKGYSFEGHNVRYLTLKLVVPLTEYDQDEEVSLPAGRETEFTDIVAKKLYSNRPIKDTSSDGV